MKGKLPEGLADALVLSTYLLDGPAFFHSQFYFFH